MDNQKNDSYKTNNLSTDVGTIQQRIQSNRRIIKSLKARADAKRTRSEKIADWMTNTFGSIAFLIANIVWFFVWMLININLLPGIKTFDAFPFGLLTMVVSLEAIILAVFVLISQNRAAKVFDLREEIDLQIDIITEQEVTKIMELLTFLIQKNGFDLSQDKVLQNMLRPTDTNKIEKIIERQI